MASVVELMQGPLCTWIKTFHDEEGKILNYSELCDGVFLHEVMLQIDPRPPHRGVCNTGGDSIVRLRNLDILVRNVKAFYEDILGQLIVFRLPDVISVCQDPDSDNAVEELKKLLLLILGCAVQCTKKEEIIESIKKFDLDVQHSIVECIQQVTDNPETVWNDQEWGDLRSVQPEQHEIMYRILVQHVKSLVKERDTLWHNVIEMLLEKDCGHGPAKLNNHSQNVQFPLGSDKHHYGVELADCKSKIRRLRQELEEKTEVLAECKEELENAKQHLSKCKQENVLLIQDARAAKTYRDELDILKERANKVDKLEMEIQRYKDKMNELEFCKSRIEELREDNRILVDTKEMLEEQLSNSRKKVEIIPELENEILRLKQRINELSLEQDSDRDRIQELLEENAHLQLATKQSMNESVNLMAELDHLRNQSSPDQGLGDSLCDQLNKDAQGRLLKLELENQRLLSLIEQMKDGSFNVHVDKLLELEKENKRLSMKVESLLDASNKETQRCLDVEQQRDEIKRETYKLQEVLDMVRVSSERQQLELQREKSQLIDLVNTLRERNEKSSDARLKDIETENKRLIENNQELKGHLSQLQFENDQLNKLNEKLKQMSDKLVEVESQKAQIERENCDLHKAIAAFRQTCDKFEKVEQENLQLQDEGRRLNKTLENLRNTCVKVEKLEHDNIFLTIENQKLTKTLESFVISNQKIVDLEHDKQELQMNLQLLGKNVDLLKIQRAKYEQTEAQLSSLTNENQKLQKSLDLITKKMGEIQQESQELESENQKLQKTVETYKVSTRKLNELERENTEFEAKNYKLHRENVSLEKEVARLKQAQEVKDLTIDELNSKTFTLEREHKLLLKDVDSVGLLTGRIEETDKENRDLIQKAAIDKKTLATLREDLVNEKIKSQQLANELGKLTSELQKVGINKEKIMAVELAQDEDRYKALENMMEEALKKGLDIKEEKIQSLQSRLNESVHRNGELREELCLLKCQHEALKQRFEEEIQSFETLAMKPEQLGAHTKEQLKQMDDLKDQLVEVKRTNSSLGTENSDLKSQLNQARERTSTMQSQLMSQQNQVTSLSGQNMELQSQIASLQVELTTLQSQNALLTSQYARLQVEQSSLEAAKEQSLHHQEEMQAAQASLVADHEALQKLHEQLSADYESLLNELGSLKAAQKSLKVEYKLVVEKNEVLIGKQEEVQQMRQSLEEEKEILKSDSKSLSNLRAEHSRLKDDFRLLHTSNERLKKEYVNIQREYKTVKTENNTLQLKYMEVKGEIADSTDQRNALEVEICKLSSKCEMLSKLNLNLNEERNSLMSQVSCLLTQYHEILTQALEDKEHFHEKEKNNMDKVNQLERQKAQLESKIMDQFIRMDNYSPKKYLGCTPKGFGANLVKKVRRAGSELINRVPRTKPREGEKDRRGSEFGEIRDNQDNSSLGSGCQDSPDSGSDVTLCNAKETASETNDVNRSPERRNSMVRSRRSKSNSVFYTTLSMPEGQGSPERGSLSSDDAVCLQTELQARPQMRYEDNDSYASNGALNSDSPSFISNQLDANCEKDELNSSKNSLSTPGSRRAVYYNDDRDTIPATQAITSGTDSPFHRSPSVSSKMLHFDNVSSSGSPLPSLRSQLPKQGHSVLRPVSEQLQQRIPSSPSSTSSLRSHGAVGSPTVSSKLTHDWDKDHGQRADGTKPSSSFLDRSSNSGSPRPSSSFDDVGSPHVNGLPTAEHRSATAPRPKSCYVPLTSGKDDRGAPPHHTPETSPTKHKAGAIPPSRLSSTNSSPAKIIPLESRNIFSEPSSSGPNADKVPGGVAGSCPGGVPGSNPGGVKGGGGSSTQASRPTSGDVGNLKSGEHTEKANGVVAAGDPAGSRERSGENSVWYEYGCV